jgi:hypothetical protein
MNEHLRPVIERAYNHYSHNGVRSLAWRAALLAYGKDMYTLGEKMGIPANKDPISNVPRHAYVDFDHTVGMSLGISPLELHQYKLLRRPTTAHTPIHVATALLCYAPAEYRSMACGLVEPAFLRKHARLEKPDVTSMTINPYVPEELGLPFKYLPIEPGEYVDEIGNLAWFTPEYAVAYFMGDKLREGWPRLMQLNTCHHLWEGLLQRSADTLLVTANDRALKDYPGMAYKLRSASKGKADAFLANCTGVRRVLYCVRDDMTPQEMKKGLSVLATTESEPVQAMYKYIGRKLTIEDLRVLTPMQALEICSSAPLEAIVDLAAHKEELGALFMEVKGLPLLLIQNALIDHSRRPKQWYPCTDASIGGMNTVSYTQATTRVLHKAQYEPLVNDFCAAYTWRNDLLEAVDPDTAFLALMLHCTEPKDSVPRVAIQNLLSTHPSAARLNELLARVPERLVKRLRGATT